MGENPRGRQAEDSRATGTEKGRREGSTRARQLEPRRVRVDAGTRRAADLDPADVVRRSAASSVVGTERDRAVVVGLVVLVAFFAVGVFDHSLWGSNDAREAGMIADAFRSGNWVVPTLNGVPFLEKPPLTHWISLALCTLLGRVDEGAMRLPSALCGLGAALLAFRWGRRLRDGRAGLFAALACATSLLYLEYSRVVLTDMCLTFVVACALEVFWWAWSRRDNRTERFSLFVLVTALAFYAKGIVGPTLVMTSVTAFLAIRGEWRLVLGLSAGTIAACVVAVFPWALSVYHEGGAEYVIQAFVDNQLGRFLSIPEHGSIATVPVLGRCFAFMADRPVPRDPYFVHKEPLHYYLRELPVPLLPWTPLVVVAIVRGFRRLRSERSAFLLLLACALAAMTLVLHVSAAKVGCYALPLFPILFVMLGVCWFDAHDAGGSPWTRRAESWTVGMMRFAVAIGAFAYLVLLVVPRSVVVAGQAALLAAGVRDVDHDPTLLLSAPGAFAAWRGAVLAAVSLAILAWPHLHAGGLRPGIDVRDAALRRFAATVAALALAASAYAPACDLQRSYAPIGALVRSELESGREVALAVDESKTIGALTFYADARIPTVSCAPGVRDFLKQPGRRGVVIQWSDFPAIEKSLSGVDHSVLALPSRTTGAKSLEFGLLTRD